MTLGIVDYQSVQHDVTVRKKEAYEGQNFVGIFLSDEAFARDLIGDDFSKTYPDIVIDWKGTTLEVMNNYDVIKLHGMRHYYIK